MSHKDPAENLILQAAFGLLESVAPGFNDDPEKAYKDLVPRLRYIVVAATQSPTITQLRALQGLSTSFYGFEGRNLIEIRRALEQGLVRLEPVVEQFAAISQAQLQAVGLDATLVPLTAAEQAARHSLAGA
jgi:hypothetical protein